MLQTLLRLRDLSNTVLVVEHDAATMLAADHIIDMGPGAGVHGGYVVTQGTPSEVMAQPESLTGRYLREELNVALPERTRRPKGFLTVVAARKHNLKSVNVSIPLGLLTCVTGVSGSGKSTLVLEVLFPSLFQLLYQNNPRMEGCRALKGADALDKVIDIDQSPIGRTPRSNPATYTGLFTFIRELFSGLPESRVRGYRPGRYSFNVKGGRCEACQGGGLIKIEMHFLPDVYVTCEACKGRRLQSGNAGRAIQGQERCGGVGSDGCRSVGIFCPRPVDHEKAAHVGGSRTSLHENSDSRPPRCPGERRSA